MTPALPLQVRLLRGFLQRFGTRAWRRAQRYPRLKALLWPLALAAHRVLNGTAVPLALQRRARIFGAMSPVARLAALAPVVEPGPALTPDTLRGRLGAGPLCVALSHDDYLTVTGGSQVVMGDEAKALAAAGWQYLHLRPARKLPLLAEAMPAEDFPLLATLGGQRLGALSMAEAIAALAGRPDARLVVHHLLGYAPEHVVALAAVFSAPPLLWAHDYFTLCPNYMLMRNDAVACGAPPPESPACGVCVYGAERQRHLARLRPAFATMRPDVIAPSEVALTLWREAPGVGFDHRRALAAPLARIEPTGPAITRRDGPLRIAYLGSPAWHKGWEVFAELAQRHAKDPRYSFHHLGQPRQAVRRAHIRHVPVRVTAQNRDAMAQAVATAGIDVALVWALWPETFCLVAQEALAGGALVLTREGAGNVAPGVARFAPERGRTVADEAALFELFAGPSLAAWAAAPRQPGRMLLSNPTAELLTAE